MHNILPVHEFLKHLLWIYLGNLLIIDDFGRFLYDKLLIDSFNFAEVDVPLGTWPQGFWLCDFQVVALRFTHCTLYNYLVVARIIPIHGFNFIIEVDFVDIIQKYIFGPLVLFWPHLGGLWLEWRLGVCRVLPNLDSWWSPPTRHLVFLILLLLLGLLVLLIRRWWNWLFFFTEHGRCISLIGWIWDLEVKEVLMLLEWFLLINFIIFVIILRLICIWYLLVLKLS